MLRNFAAGGTGPRLAHPMRVRFSVLALVLALAAAGGFAHASAQEPAPPAAAAPVAGPGDTLLVRQVGGDPAWWETVATIASGLMAVAILALAAALVPAAWNFRKNHKAVRQLIERFENDVAPIVRHASSIADDVNYVTTSIRSDVQQVNQTVAAANRRLLQAVEKAEDRINDFNALLEVVQEEAESAFVSTASTLRGLRTGASALAGGGNGPRRARAGDRELRKRMAELRAAIDEDLEEETDEAAAAMDDSFGEEDGNGDDYDGRGTADGRS